MADKKIKLERAEEALNKVDEEMEKVCAARDYRCAELGQLELELAAVEA